MPGGWHARSGQRGAHDIEIHPNCSARPIGRSKAEPGPQRIFIGEADGLTSAAAWVAFGARQRAAGVVHRALALPAALVALGVVVTATWNNRRLALMIQSPRSPLNMFVWGNHLTLVAYAVLLSVGISFRNQSAIHRRWVLLASIATIFLSLGRGTGLGLSEPGFAALKPMREFT